MEAIQTAAVQVLLADGATRLTTTRVARRAGVSVGTLYQYYPHKQALMFAILERHLAAIEESMALAFDRLTGCDLDTMADGIVDAWLDAKTSDIAASRAIYGIAAEFDIAAMIERGSAYLRRGIGALLASASDGVADRDTTAFMLVTLLGGSTRAVMELGASPEDIACLRRELPRACRGYLSVVRAGDPAQAAGNAGSAF